MHFRTVLHIISVVLLFLGLAMLLPLGVALADGATDVLPLLISLAATAVAGIVTFALTMPRGERPPVTHRDAYLAAVLGWLAASIAAALPFYLYAHLSWADPAWTPGVGVHEVELCSIPAETLHPAREFCSFTDSMFESISGITTTGASVIRAGLWDRLDVQLSSGLSALPRGFLLWRSLIQWLGGMGILVLAVTALSLVGGGGMQLMRTEVPGPTPGRLSPRIADTARLLWKLYAVISAVQILMLIFGGMDWYNAICHTCTTMATGGFSTLSGSVGGMNSPYFEWILTLFMLAAGTNFALHYGLVFGRAFGYHKDAEFRTYSAIFVFGVLSILLFLFLAGRWEGLEPTLRSAAFQSASILTTTGYATRDFALWPVYLQLLLLAFMFIGGCAGSTGGGIKVVRFQVMFKFAYRELFRIAHPRSVSAVRYGHTVVPNSGVQAILGVVILFVGGFAVSSLMMAAMGLDPVTAVSSVAACIGNIGPGLAEVGPTGNYFLIPQAGKWVLMLNMLAGRLEMFTVLVLLSPHFWRR